MATELASFVSEYGVSVVGGCCGSTPEHIRELVARVGAASRAQVTPDVEPRLASSMHAIDLRQQPAPLLIGERVNAQGSRAIKRLLLADDYDGILGIATDAGRRRRARARPVRRGHRAQRRGGADADGRQDAADEHRCATRHRQHRRRRHQGGARGVSGSRHRQQRQPRERTGALRRGAAVGARPRRLRHRADHRRAGHGAHRRSQARDRAPDPRPRARRLRPDSGPADLRCAHLHARHR